MNAFQRRLFPFLSFPLCLYIAVFAVSLLVTVSGAALAAEHRVTLQLFGGGAVNLPSSLTVEQDGRPAIEKTASFETRPFEQPLDWAVRASPEDRTGA